MKHSEAIRCTFFCAAVRIDDATVIAAGAAAGVELRVLSGPCNEHHGAWSVLGIGAPGLLNWWSDRGFRYRARFGRRWKLWATGKRLETVLREIARDVERERVRMALVASFYEKR